MADISVVQTTKDSSGNFLIYPSYTIIASSSSFKTFLLDGSYRWSVAHNGVDSTGTAAANGLIIISSVTGKALDCTEEADKIVLLGGVAIYRSVRLPHDVTTWYYKASTGSPTFQLIRSAYLFDGSGM